MWLFGVVRDTNVYKSISYIYIRATLHALDGTCPEMNLFNTIATAHPYYSQNWLYMLLGPKNMYMFIHMRCCALLYQ